MIGNRLGAWLAQTVGSACHINSVPLAMLWMLHNSAPVFLTAILSALFCKVYAMVFIFFVTSICLKRIVLRPSFWFASRYPSADKQASCKGGTLEETFYYF